MQPEFLRRAIDLAIENVRSGQGGPFAAVIVKDGRVIVTGTNRVTATNDPTAHAEIVAIRDACRELKTFDLAGCEIYSSCEPCPMCLGAIYWARLEGVYFAATAADAAAAGFDDSRIYEEFAKAPAQRNIRFTSAMREEALEAFRACKEKGGRIAY